MVLTDLQKGALGVAAIAGFLGLLSIKARAEEPLPECEEGTIEVISYCDDGITPFAVRECINGIWVEQTQTCPIIPVCTPNTVEILEYCQDGTVKAKRTCNPDGTDWVETLYDCPSPIVEECVCTEWVAEECSAGDRVFRRNCVGEAAGAIGCETVKVEPDPTCTTMNVYVMDADTNTPLSGANVSLPDLGLSCISDANGFCGFRIEYGKVSICVSKEGYENKQSILGECFGTDVATMTVWMKSTTIETAAFQGYVKGITTHVTPYEEIPLPNATITVVNNTTGKTYNVAVDAGGHFYGLVGRDGEYINVTISAEGFITQTMTVGGLPYSRSFTLELEIKPALLIIYAGEIEEYMGIVSTKALADVTITVDNLQIFTGSDGYCRPFPLVNPGTYIISASKPGYVTEIICASNPYGCWDTDTLEFIAIGEVNHSITLKMRKL